MTIEKLTYIFGILSLSNTTLILQSMVSSDRIILLWAKKNPLKSGD